MIVEHTWLGHDNTIDLLLTADGVAVDLSAVTRMTLEAGGVTIDSDVSADAFDWSGVTGKLILALGDEALVPGGHIATLTVYDPSNTNGIVWGRFRLVVG